MLRIPMRSEPPTVAELEEEILGLKDVLVDLRMQATRHTRGTDKKKYLLRDLEFITDKITQTLDDAD